MLEVSVEYSLCRVCGASVVCDAYKSRLSRVSALM